jgi:NAD-dependent SIR2 family protein deacetylase
VSEPITDLTLGVKVLAEMISNTRPSGTVSLVGAGLSTDSGIPDYRGPTGVLRRHAPMTFHAFLSDPVARHRYWARSYLGWRQIADARPNDGHHALAALQRAGAIGAVITQNVDGLHQAAGTDQVVELHGGLDRATCLNCGCVVARSLLDVRLVEANRHFTADVERINPDGDAELSDDDLGDFVMIDCSECGHGPIKPDVVFFGESVPRDRVERCFGLVDASELLLVLGSSLHVMSGYRFVLRAVERGIPVAVVNQGPTRADAKVALKLDLPLTAVLTELAQQLECPARL